MNKGERVYANYELSATHQIVEGEPVLCLVPSLSLDEARLSRVQVEKLRDALTYWLKLTEEHKS